MPTPDPKPNQTELIWTWIQRLLTPMLAILVAIFTWLSAQAWTYVTQMDTRLRIVELWRADISSRTFTNADWAKQKTQLDRDSSALDRRVTRLEEAIPPIRESLNRIEAITDDIRKGLRER